MLEQSSILASTTVETTDPVTDPAWRELALSQGSVFSSPPWLAALADTYGFGADAWITRDSTGSVTGGMPFVRLGDGQWERLSSLAFSDYCNPIDPDGTSWPVLAERIVATGLPAEVRHLGDGGPVADPMFTPVGPPDRWHAVSLDADEERAWSVLPGSVRRAIRKARSSGLEVRVGNDPDLLRNFFDLHLATRKVKYRLLAQPFRLFTALRDRFGDDLAVLGAWHGDKMIAGILLLAWGNTLYYKFNASSPQALEMRPNDLLMWEATRLGVSRDLATLDLGRTDSDHESLARYKSKYATVEQPIHTLRSGEFRRDPSLAGVLGPITEMLTRPEVPDDVTEEAGNLLYRHFA